LGRAIIREFAREGARIGLLARGRDRLEEARREVEALGGRALILPADVAEAEALERAAEAVEREFGPIDIWVNNAMATVFAPFEQIMPEEFKRATEVNYLGYVHGTMAALKRMKPRDRGVIVQVGSALAYRSIPLQSAYCGAKHAMVGFTDSIRSELLHDGSNVHITIAHMPALNTPQFEWSRSRMQGRRVDAWRDEQPGRIIRAAQRGPLVRLGQSPFDRYYGDFASPFDFIFALGQLYAWSGDRRQLKKHWDVARRVMDWAREYGTPARFRKPTSRRPGT
jgi:NAD(P)-dependent dehydrogenase (short-subunit alcohol dehydrogenase family)